MDLILFDLGGTLIDDPFEDVLRLIRPDILISFRPWNLGEDAVTEFIESWRVVNLRSDHPFASHFLQEEIWIAEALMILHQTRQALPVEQIPLLSLGILKRYREFAAVQISAQPQLASLRDLLVWLQSRGTTVGVASNDREFATRTMLTWAHLAEHMEWVFTSEGLSRKYSHAEKPAPEFFRAIFSELNRSIGGWKNVFYVGDSEKNDIIPAKALGIRTVRFLNKGNRKDASWLDSTMATAADYHCSERGQLLEIFRTALNDLTGTYQSSRSS